MELNIGDYVRTKDGIEKIICIEENFMDDDVTFYATDNDVWRSAYNGKHNGFTSRSDVIIKSSPNIIDLIEVGDLIKLYSTKQIQQVLAINYEEINLTDYVFYDLKNSKKELIKQIEWVITHEQIESMKYEVR